MGFLKLLTGALLLISFTTIVTSRFHGRAYKAYPTRGYIPKATPTPECKDTITCGSAQFVAKCVTCRPEYFYCKTPGAPPLVMECGPGLVFNPDRNYPRCILKDNCPYHPPWTLPTTPPPPTTTPAATTAPATTAPATTAASTAPGASTTAGDTVATGDTTASEGNTTTGDTTTSGDTAASGDTTAPGASTTPGATTSAGDTTAPVTTTAADTTTTAPAPTTTSECVDTLTCPAKGFFAQCVTCQPNYFQCSAKDTPGILRQCTGGMVFNTDPAYPRCVLASNCPYHPSL
ncbi:uncharacterized protein [Palaemon carinicauda]|uniref:uncharacterized protein n=1 Tax=Palaemon carinicauda TaxID=392227 RepID=UPI0035B67B41